MTDLYEMEQKLHEKGYKAVCGIDEAGRGPLAGPVYACAVILPNGYHLDGLNDSKKLSEKKREQLFEQLRREIKYSVGVSDVSEIDSLNILNATYLAMERAVAGLEIRPDFILIDGNGKPSGLNDVACETVVGGDGKVAAIAAASIIAKVSRDRCMRKLAEEYPQYEFEKHKGYGTKIHYEKLLLHGISDVHRKSFLKNLEEKRAAFAEVADEKH